MQQFLTFFVDYLFFGIEVEKVQEVLGHQHMTRVPLAPPVVRGLINLRGQIVTAIDLRKCLKLGEAPANRLHMNMVIRTEDGMVSLLVDEIGDVVKAGEESFEHPPETLTRSAQAMVRGIYKLDDRLIHVLDAEKLVAQESEGKR